MFEKEAKERARDFTDNEGRQVAYECGFLDGADRMREEIKHELMLKLKDEGIVKPLKDSIISNKKLSSQEQQELCAWIECAMRFGEMLDECAKELEAGKDMNVPIKWHKVADGDLPKYGYQVLSEEGVPVIYNRDTNRWFEYSPNADNIELRKWEEPIAWCEIPEVPNNLKESK